MKLWLFFIVMMASVISIAQSKGKPTAKPAAKVVKQSGQALYKQAIELYQKEKYTHSLAKLEMALALNKKDTQSVIAKTLNYAALKNQKQAALTIQNFFKPIDTAANYLAYLSSILPRDQQVTVGIYFTNESIRLSPNQPFGYLFKAALLEQDSNYVEAAAVADKVFVYGNDEIKKGFAASYASLLLNAGQREKAYSTIRDYVTKYPNDRDVKRGLYLLYEKEKKYADALVVINEVLPTSTDSTTDLLSRLFLHEDMKQFELACADLHLINMRTDKYESLAENLKCPEAYGTIVTANRALYYAVDYYGTTYDFIVKPSQVDMNNGIVFDWNMTISDDKKGKVNMSRDALDTAHAQKNTFAGGSDNLTNSTTVWVSKKVFSELKEKGESLLNTGENGYKLFKVVKEEDEVIEKDGIPTYNGKASLNGNIKLVHMLHIKSTDGKEELWINDDAANPLILKMDIGWIIELRSIEDAE